MKKCKFILTLVLAAAILTGCGSGGEKKAKPKKEKAQYQSGNLYGEYGKQITVSDIIDSLIVYDITGVTSVVMNFGWSNPKPYYVFTETEGNVDGGFYVGQKDKNGPEYTWSAREENVRSLKEMCEKISWQKPVYVSYNNKSVPLTAYIDETGDLVSALGLNVENPIYVGIDTVKHADIWYCFGMGNDIKNQYYRLSAFSVAIGECAFAQAESNALLLKDIARLTGAKAGLSETDTDVELSDEDIKAIAAKVDSLDKSIKDKIKINQSLTNAVNGAVMASITEGVKLAGQIANDVAEVAVHALDPEWIVAYAKTAYGPTKEMQTVGKLADKQADANYKYGSARLKIAQEMLKKQKAQFNAIMKDDGQLDL